VREDLGLSVPHPGQKQGSRNHPGFAGQHQLVASPTQAVPVAPQAGTTRPCPYGHAKLLALLRSMWAIIRVYHCLFFPTSRHDYRVRGSQNLPQPSHPSHGSIPSTVAGRTGPPRRQPSSRNSAMVRQHSRAPRSDAGVLPCWGGGCGGLFSISSTSSRCPGGLQRLSPVQSSTGTERFSHRGSGVGRSRDRCSQSDIQPFGGGSSAVEGARKRDLSGHSLAPILQVRRLHFNTRSQATLAGDGIRCCSAGWADGPKGKILRRGGPGSALIERSSRSRWYK